jgi:hypothetical protein
MALRVVVYAEGALELSGIPALPRAAGAHLPERELGAAHVLVRRTIAHIAAARGEHILFEEPLLLVPDLRKPRGSDFLVPKNMRRLLSWHPSARRPHLAVVLLDEDGVEGRLQLVQGFLDDPWPTPVAIGVAVQEFESWLIGDMNAVRKALGGSPIDEPTHAEGMSPGHAKVLLGGWTRARSAVSADASTRRRIAEELQLEVLASASRSFKRFRDALREAVSRVTPEFPASA